MKTDSFKLRDYVEGSSLRQKVINRHEWKRIRELTLLAYKRLVVNIGLDKAQSHENLKNILAWAQLSHELMLYDIRRPEHIPYQTLSGLANVCAIVSGTIHRRVEFVSFASNALTSDGRIKEKRQYKRFDQISNFLENVGRDLQIDLVYRVILSDHDYLFPPHKYTRPWGQNLEALREQTRVSVQLLSDSLPWADVQKLLTRHELIVRRLEGDQEVFNHNLSTRLSFKTTPERCMHQRRLYAAVGAWLEANLPTCVIMDVQKREYPYEQPCFQRLRTVPLPLIRCP